MLFKVKSDLLQSALSEAGRASDSRSPCVDFQRIGLSAKDGQVMVTGKGGWAFIESAVVADVEAAGSIMVDSAKIRSLCRAAPGEQITVDGASKVVKFRSDTLGFTLPKYDGEHKQAWRTGDPSLSTSGDDLARLLKCVAFCPCVVPGGNARLWTDSVLLCVRDGKLYAVASDGRRMVTSLTGVCTVHPDWKQVMVPKGVVDLVASCVRGQAAVTLTGNNQLEIHGDSVSLCVPLQSGNYPKWEQVMEKEEPTKASLPAGMMNELLREAAIIAGDAQDGGWPVDMAISTDGTLSIVADELGGTYCRTVKVLDQTGPDAICRFNAKMATQYLGGLSGDVQIGIGGPDDSLVCTEKTGLSKYVQASLGN